MKILVTGGAGYIGSITSKLLLDSGHQVVVFDSLELGHREAVDPRASLVVGDLRNPADIAAAMLDARPDAVLHFAAYALVGESCREPEKYFRNNVYGGLNLVEAMRGAGVRRIVFSSSCATYGQPERLPITESTPQRPTNPYGESKLMFEKILGWYRQIHGFEPVCLRYFNACGASGALGEDHAPETHIIPNVLKAALGQLPKVTIFGRDYRTPDGTCVRDYVHVDDLAAAHKAAVEGGAVGAFNLGTGRGFSVAEIVEAARAVTGIDIPAEYGPRRPGDPDELVADPSEAARTLGWTAKHTEPADIIATAWAWHKAHPHGYAVPAAK